MYDISKMRIKTPKLKKESKMYNNKDRKFIDNHFNTDISNPNEVLMRTKLLIQRRKNGF